MVARGPWFGRPVVARANPCLRRLASRKAVTGVVRRVAAFWNPPLTRCVAARVVVSCFLRTRGRASVGCRAPASCGARIGAASPESTVALCPQWWWAQGRSVSPVRWPNRSTSGGGSGTVRWWRRFRYTQRVGRVETDPRSGRRQRAGRCPNGRRLEDSRAPSPRGAGGPAPSTPTLGAAGGTLSTTSAPRRTCGETPWPAPSSGTSAVRAANRCTDQLIRVAT